MATPLQAAVDNYLRAKSLARGTRNEYLSTLRKWEQWGGGGPIEELRRKDIRAFLDWVYERAVAEAGTNPGRTANKAREKRVMNHPPGEMLQYRHRFSPTDSGRD